MKVKNFLKSFFSMFLILTILIASGLPVSASVKFPVGRETEWSENNILFYNPGSTDCTPIGDGGGIIGWDGHCDVLSDSQKEWVDKWYNLAHTLGKTYNIPWEAAMGQSIIESGTGTSKQAREKNNFFGIGSFDSDSSKAYAWPSPEEGWRGYFKFIAGERPNDINNHSPTSYYKKAGATSPPASTNPYIYIRILKQVGYATDASYINKVSGAICGVERYAQGKGYELSNGAPAQDAAGAELVGLNSTSFATLAAEPTDQDNEEDTVDLENEPAYDTDGSNVTIIGDSINVVVSGVHTVEGANGGSNANHTNFYSSAGLPNATIYARWGRGFSQSRESQDSISSDMPAGTAVLQDLANNGSLRKIVVFALGTNNNGADGGERELTQSDIDTVINLAGDRAIIFVTNVAMVDGNAAGFATNNNLFKQAAQNHENVYVADWYSLVASDPRGMMKDIFHPSQAGAKAYAEMIKALVQEIDLNNLSGSGGGGSISSTNGIMTPCPPGGSGEAGEIVDGGFNTVEEAANFMRIYIDEARKRENARPKLVAGTQVDAPSTGFPKDGTLNNCSAFTQWFVRHYLGIQVPLVNGRDAVHVYRDSYGLEFGGNTPQVYAVMSIQNPNHTGIVLGINKETDTIIIGEASYHNGFVEGVWPYAHKGSLSAHMGWNYTYAYTGLGTGAM